MDYFRVQGWWGGGTSLADMLPRGERTFEKNWFEIMRRQRLAGRRDPANGAYFRFLGLRSGESDPEAIRGAASAMAGVLSDCEGQYGVEGSIRRRSEIALATYRLIDPRQRESLVERVQLCYPIDHQERKTEIRERDFNVKPSSNPWVEPIALAQEPTVDRPVLMTQPVIERAIQEEASEPVAAQAMADTMSWLEERREVIRHLRTMEREPSPSTVSPFSWIRSVLGW